MPILIRWCLALCVLVCSGAAQAAGRLLWVTADITPAARTAQVESEGQRLGWQVQHLQWPLQGPAEPEGAQRQHWRAALAQADQVWVDMPHATVQARLQRVLEPLLAASPHARVVWVPAGPGVLPAAPSMAQRLAAYLQAGGQANLRHAWQLAQAWQQGVPPPALPEPAPWPARGLYHPDAPGILGDARAMAAWQATQATAQGRPAVAVLVHRHHFVDGETAWLDAWLRMFARQGLWAYAVFGQQLDATGLRALLENADGSAHPQALVLHQLVSQPAAMQPLLARWGVPLLATQPWRSGTEADWTQSPMGLPLSDVPYYLAQPEGAGAVDPVLVTATAERGRRTVLIERQAQAVVGRVQRLLALQERPRAQRALVAMVYNYPPGGSNFGASFLNVPRSLQRVSGALAQAGYATQEVPEGDWIAGLQPLLAAYYPDAALRSLLEQDRAEALPLARYRQFFDALPQEVRARIQAHWGPPERSRYVLDWQGEPVFVIPRMRVGTLAVLPQPPREETLRLGQNPFMHKSKAPLSHHYLAVYLWTGQADVLLHFGTHGTQEWASGKARSPDVWDDVWLPLGAAAGHIPVVYPYIVDNLGEALTAKRRGRAVLVSHRTPAFAPAGFNARMAHMHELMHEWETVDAGPTRQALELRLIAQFVEHQLHRDLGWTADAIARDFEGYLEQLHPYLDRLAQSSQPQGLAVLGEVPSQARRRQTILQALRQPLIEALGEDIDEAFLIDHRTVATARPARWLDVALRDADAASRLDLRPAQPASAPAGDGASALRGEDFVPNRAARQPIDTAALHALALRAQELERLLATEGEIPGLLAALDGRYLTAAYGGDPIRNPDSLPTGRNLTGLDPSRLPTRQAYEVAQRLFQQWLDDWRAAHGGSMPQRLALSLWAGETLRHQGVMESQALVALGVRPVWDSSGRPQRVELIPHAQLGRERVDVLLSVTGSYRDQFPALMALIDQAVALAAGAEPANAVARNTAAVQSALRRAGVPAAQALALAQARSFGNQDGDYGTGLSDAVQDGGLRRDDPRLGELFLQRMSQPFLHGEPVPAVARTHAVQALGAHLRQTDAAVLSRSSHLYAMVSSDDPFQYLGGLAAAARAAGKKDALALYVSELHDSSEVHTESAQRNIAREMQSRYLHPGWLQAQQAEGYAGTLQVLKAVQFAWGWQAVAPDTIRPDHWQSFFDVLVKDRHQLGTPQWLRQHPQAYAQALERLVQASRLGHWQPDAATRTELARTYAELTQAAPLALELREMRQWVRQQTGAGPALEPRQALRPERGAGLEAPARAPASPPLPSVPQATPPAAPPVASGMAQPVTGMLLQAVQPPALTHPSAAERKTQLLVLLVLLAVVLAGALRQWVRQRGPVLAAAVH